MSNKRQQQKRFKPKYRLKKGDEVRVISGNHKGTEGRILKIITQKGRAIVEGVNQVVKHQKPNAENPQGGTIKQEAPIDMSNLMLLDPKTGEPTRVGRRIEDGKIVRYSKKSGEVLK